MKRSKKENELIHLKFKEHKVKGKIIDNDCKLIYIEDFTLNDNVCQVTTIYGDKLSFEVGKVLGVNCVEITYEVKPNSIVRSFKTYNV